MRLQQLELLVLLGIPGSRDPGLAASTARQTEVPCRHSPAIGSRSLRRRHDPRWNCVRGQEFTPGPPRSRAEFAGLGTFFATVFAIAGGVLLLNLPRGTPDPCPAPVAGRSRSRGPSVGNYRICRSAGTADTVGYAAVSWIDGLGIGAAIEAARRGLRLSPPVLPRAATSSNSPTSTGCAAGLTDPVVRFAGFGERRTGW